MNFYIVRFRYKIVSHKIFPIWLNFEQMQTSHTIIRWLQPYHNGNDYDQWAIDNVEIVTLVLNEFKHACFMLVLLIQNTSYVLR